MKKSFFYFCILSTSFLYGLHESNLTEEEKVEENEKKTIFLFAHKAEYKNDYKEKLRENLRKYPHTINTCFNKTTPYFMDIAYRGWWHVFELLLEEQENKESPCDIYVSKKDKDRNNLIHVLIQTNTPPHLLERTCKLFPHLLKEYNYEEHQRVVPLLADNEREGDCIVFEYSTLTPLELLLITKKDPWVAAQILLKYGAKITDIARFSINNDKHPQTKQIFEKHTTQLNMIESLPLPYPLPSPRNRPNYHLRRRSHIALNNTTDC
ncbi:hypothetical protein K9K77_01995 [Candidatus Babeliales bacterium]|nr:hypothetical protein [Candidatus Babeliales bacterium]